MISNKFALSSLFSSMCLFCIPNMEAGAAFYSGFSEDASVNKSSTTSAIEEPVAPKDQELAQSNNDEISLQSNNDNATIVAEFDSMELVQKDTNDPMDALGNNHDVDRFLVKHPACNDAIKWCTKKGPLGKVYFGAAAAYARIQAPDVTLLKSSLLGVLPDIIGNQHTTSGGLGWRAFAGALLDVSSTVSLGTEVGYSHYPQGTARASTLIFVPVDARVKFKAFGVDILLNMTVYPIPEFFLTVKPGLQLSHQRTTVQFDLSSIVNLIGPLPAPFDVSGGKLKDVYSDTSILPEVVLSTGWNFMNGHIWGWKFAKAPIVLEIFYQHVFGHDSAPVTGLQNSRDMFGITGGVRF